jgi:hypothetical protein
MRKLLIFALLSIYFAAVIGASVPQFSQEKLEMIRDEMNKLHSMFSTARKIAVAGKVGDMSIQCGICGIVVNEIEAFAMENKTITDITGKLQTGVCNHVSGFFQTICNELIQELPAIVESVENRYTVSEICVHRGWCDKPIDNLPDPQPIPEVVVNLDLPPTQRLTTLCNNPTYQNVSKWLVSMAAQLMPRIHGYMEELGFLLNKYYFPSEQSGEIKSCAATIGVSEGWLAMFNIGYEISDFCTSIVAQTPDGRVLHARNLDFWDGMGFTNSLKQMAVIIDYQSNGQTIFKSVGFAGYVGVLSGFKSKAFSATVDTRFYPEGVGSFFYEVIAAITTQNASLVTFLMRKVFTHQNDYASALQYLSNSPLIADVYYIMAGAGPNQGAVISRNRHNASDVWELNKNRWFEVQTNYDHWVGAPWFDDRITPSNNAMSSIGQRKISLDTMYTVLSTKPVFNLQTTYSFLASPADGVMKAVTRHCPFPCVE